jgi:hypothetical protein
MWSLSSVKPSAVGFTRIEFPFSSTPSQALFRLKCPRPKNLFIEKFGCFLAMFQILVTVMSQEIYICFEIDTRMEANHRTDDPSLESFITAVIFTLSHLR